MNAELHPLAADYLDRLLDETRRLPPRASRELLSDIEAHLAEATAPTMSEADVLTVLDRLGDPGEIVDAQAPRDIPSGRSHRGIHEWAAIFLLLLGGFIGGIGWVAGLVLLWSSGAWRTREKLVGTLVLPGGLSAFFIVLLVTPLSNGGTCEAIVNGFQGTTGPCGGPDILIIVELALLFLTPIGTAMYLARQADQTTSTITSTF